MLRFVFCIWMFLGAVDIGAAEIRFDFAKTPVNETPIGFRSVIGGEGNVGEWKIVEDEVATAFRSLTTQAATSGKRPVLAQLSKDMTDEHFPMLVYEGEAFGDFTVTTRFKVVSGEKEQMAGLAFRMRDEKNYYYVRASSLGNTFRFFKVVDGQRSAPIGPDMKIPAGVWHELSIECKGSRIRCLLNGQEAMPELSDHTFNSGKIAFWTKSDSVVYFADARITYKPLEPVAQALIAEVMNRYPRLVGLKIIGAGTAEGPTRVIASTAKEEIGRPGEDFIRKVIEKNSIYYAKEQQTAVVTMPLHDRNGETIAAVRILMESFRGQTEQNALARALPVVKLIEERLRSISNLFE